MTQKTVYDLKLLVIFLKKSVMFFKKLVMFYQSLAALCCFPVYPLIIYKTALDKICLIHDVKGQICKISSTTWATEVGYDKIFVIRTFVVHPAFMHTGVGWALMRFSIEQAALCGIKSIRLDVYEKNLPAISLYEKCGFHYMDTVDLGLGNYGLHWFKLYEKLV